MRLLPLLVTLAVALAVTRDAPAQCKVKKLYKKVRDCSADSTTQGLNAATLDGQPIKGLLSQQTSQLRGIISEAIYGGGSFISLAPQICDCVSTACDMGDQVISCDAEARLSDQPNTVPTNFHLREIAYVTVTGMDNTFGCDACGCNTDQTASITFTVRRRCLKTQ